MKREIVDDYWDILDVLLKHNDHPEKEYDQVMPSNTNQLEEKLRDPESSKKLGNLLKVYRSRISETSRDREMSFQFTRRDLSDV